MTQTQQTADPRITSLFEAGAHFGYSKTRRHPSTRPYIFNTKNRVDIFDLEKTTSLIAEAEQFMTDLGRMGKMVLFVGTKPEAKAATKKAAEMLSLPYVTERWIGGTLTNFPEIRKRVEHYIDLSEKESKDELVYQTKKERLLIERSIAKLETKFGGITSLDRIPDAIFIIDSEKESIARTESEQVRIPVIGIANSDCDISKLDYPIVANDASQSSIQYLMNLMAEAYHKGQASA